MKQTNCQNQECSALYDFCRVADNIADDEGEIENKKKKFEQFENDFNQKRLNDPIVKNMWDLIENIRNSGKTIIITTHYMEEAEKLCDRVAIIDTGQIVTIDTPKALIKKLLDSGFEVEEKLQNATLEDVFINLTGKSLREN